jgi:hypothetical protein
MSGFQKRVALLEKWVPSLLPQLKNIDDMAEIILDVWDEAEAHTEERIIKLLEGFTCGKHSIPEFCKWLGIDDQCNTAQNAIELIKGETND